MQDKFEKYTNLILEMVRFGIMGCVNVVINLICYWVLISQGMHYGTAYGIGYMVSIVNAYFMGNKFVFKKEDAEENKVLGMIKVFAVYTATLLMSEMLLKLQIDHLGITKTIAPILNLCIVSPISFLLNKFWAFGDQVSLSEKSRQKVDRLN